MGGASRFRGLAGTLPGLAGLQSRLRRSGLSGGARAKRMADLAAPYLTRRGRMAQECPEHIARRINVPIACTTVEDRRRSELIAHGQHLARQDRWEDLGLLIQQYDKSRAATTTGMPLAELLAFGARQDITQPVENALTDPGLMPAHAPRGGLTELEHVLDEHPDDYGVALVVAHAHIDIGWAWRGAHYTDDIPPRDWQRFKRHFERASEILDQFDPFAEDSPALLAARCALLAAEDMPQSRVADDFEDLIDLDPANPRHMRSLGYHLLPRWFGSYVKLDFEARRTAERTADIWGKGGYVWTYLDAITVDPDALDLVDGELFSQGLKDILSRRDDQHTVNLLAAFCAVTLWTPRYSRLGKGGEALTRLRKNTGWIVKRHLKEVHPMIWGLAAHRPGTDHDPTELASQGRSLALANIARLFEKPLRKGAQIDWTEKGPTALN